MLIPAQSFLKGPGTQSFLKGPGAQSFLKRPGTQSFLKGQGLQLGRAEITLIQRGNAEKGWVGDGRMQIRWFVVEMGTWIWMKVG